MTNTPVEIIPAEPRHRETLLDLIAAYHEYDNISSTSARRRIALDGLMSDPTAGRIWVAQREGSLVGYVALTFDYSLEFGGREGFIDELFVSSNARSQGVGRALLSHATRAARAMGLFGLNIVVEQANDAALEFYKQCGWGAPHRVLLYKDLDAEGV